MFSLKGEFLKKVFNILLTPMEAEGTLNPLITSV